MSIKIFSQKPYFSQFISIAKIFDLKPIFCGKIKTEEVIKLPENNTLYIIALIVIILIGIYLFISYMMYRRIFVDYNKPEKNLVDHEEEFYQESYRWFQDIPKEEISIKSYDNLKLKGYFIPSIDKKSEKIAIVMHGYQSKGTDMIIIAKMYSDMGFKVVLPDLRGHGKSEGKFTSMGHYEKYDLKRWFNFCLTSYGATDKILIHGVSMGAAMAIMLTALDIPKNLKFMVLDSGYTRFKGTLRHTFRSKYLSIFLPGLSLITYFQHRYFLSQLRPIKAMRKNEVPFLIIHGEKDQLVPLKMAKDLLKAAKTDRKELLIVKDARHALGYKVDKELCTERIIANIQPIFKIRNSDLKKMS